MSLSSSEFAVRSAFGDNGFSVAFECAGAETAVNDLLARIDKGGTVVAVALYGQRPKVDMSMVTEHQLAVLGSLMYQKPDYLQTVAWLAEGKIRTAPLESRHFPFAQYPEA